MARSPSGFGYLDLVTTYFVCMAILDREEAGDEGDPMRACSIFLTAAKIIKSYLE